MYPGEIFKKKKKTSIFLSRDFKSHNIFYSRMTSEVEKLIKTRDIGGLETFLKDTKHLIQRRTISPTCLSHEEDELAKFLLPTDLPELSLNPVKTSGNGDCLYNAASIGLIGSCIL